MQRASETFKKQAGAAVQMPKLYDSNVTFYLMYTHLLQMKHKANYFVLLYKLLSNSISRYSPSPAELTRRVADGTTVPQSLLRTQS